MSPKEFTQVRTGTYKNGGTFWCWHRWKIDERVGLAHYKECSKCNMRVGMVMYTGNTRGSVNIRWVNRLTDDIRDYGPRPVPPPPAPSKR
jgi:hypothetical protein